MLVLTMEVYKRNIQLFGILKIFTKRVFLPLTAIYLVEIGGLSLYQIGLLATISAIVSLLSEIPTGYFADRISRKTSMMTGGMLAALSTLVLAFRPDFTGAIVAVSIEAIGYSFLSGAAEAIIHDSLVIMKQPDNYAKVAGRAQSLGLIGNTILVSLAPLTYSIDKRLPFLIGTLAYSTLVLIASLFNEPPRVNKPRLHKSLVMDLGLNLKLFVYRASVLVFLCVGIIGALHNTSGDFTNLIFKDQGINPSLLGFVFAASSIAGIVGGYFIHLLRNISLRIYAIMDVLIFGAYAISIGYFNNLWVTIVAFVICMGWWRLRSILYQHHLLKAYKTSHYKATLISTLSFFIRSNEVWLPFVYTAVITSVGFYAGYIWIGSASIILLVPMFILSTGVLQRSMTTNKQL